MLGSFTLPQRRLTTASVQFGPASFGRGGQGIMAFGNF
jgi:hypothetical protein